jgi:hypothetical protein
LFLDDPYDLSKGSLGPKAFILRSARGAALSLRDLGLAICTPSISGLTSVGVAFLLLLAPCRLGLREGPLTAAYVIPCLGLLVLWPYKGSRFAIPILPVAAWGIAVVAQHLRGRQSVTAACALLFLSHLANATWTLRNKAIDERAARLAMHANFADLAHWIDANVPASDELASFDYRELMLRLNRQVVPLWYSTDHHAHITDLHEQGVTWLITSGAIVDLRGSYAEAVLQALGSEAQRKYSNDAFEVYALGR